MTPVTVGAQELPRKWGEVSWTRLSSDDGDLEVPFPGAAEQTDGQVFDIDNDGIDDIVITSRNVAPANVWYRRDGAGWTRHVIEATSVPLEAGGTNHDVDGDGDLDLVVGEGSTGDKIHWWENPFPNYDPDTPWVRHLIKDGLQNKHHDVIFGDVDGDGADEFIFWNGEKDLRIAEVPADPKAGVWPSTSIFFDQVSPRKNEGLAIADVNLDGVDDIVGAGRWFEYGDPSWIVHVIDPAMEFTRAAAGQLIPGGRPEILFVIGDVSGDIDGTSFLTMYEWDGAEWVATSLLPFLTHAGHSLDIVDFNRDGLLDIFSAEMVLGGNDDAAGRVLYGDGTGQFTVQEFSTGLEHHQSKVGDLDGDGDLDIMGKPFTAGSPAVHVWLNTDIDPGVLPLDQWVRYSVDPDQPWLASHVQWGDFDFDGFTDIVSGGWVYESDGGDYSAPWSRTAVGAPLNNVALVHDFDQDGDLDLLGTDGQSQSPTHPGSTALYWGRNEGDGTFTVLNNITPGVATDQSDAFIQGIVPFDVGNDGALDIAISWNFGEFGESGIDLLTVPPNPSSDTWPLVTISDVSEGEELALDDIDGDGDLDIFQGSGWLQNSHPVWTRFDSTTLIGQNDPYDDPDRVSLADIDGDGDKDAVIGLLFATSSIPTDVVWLEHPSDPMGEWPLHVIGSGIGGGFSMSVGDVDNDGDADVVLGEHVLQQRLLIFENVDAGTSWVEHVVDDGLGVPIDHHDGALLVDFENDGDLDVVSVGWHNQKVWLYENKALEPGDTSDIEPPTAPTGVVATAFSSTQIDLTWERSLDNRGISGYRVLRDGSEVGLAGSLRFSDTGLSPTTSYEYNVVAIDQGGNESPPSTAASASTPTPDLTPPTPPSGFAANASVQWVDLSWGPGTDDRGVVSYVLRRDGEEIAILGPDATGFFDSDLSPDTAFLYELVAFDADGNGSDPLAAQITAITLAPPTGLWAAYAFEDTGPTIVDSSVYGNDGTLEPSALLVVDGYSGAALQTNGIAGHVDLGRLDIPTPGLTMMAWIHAESFDPDDGRILSKSTGSRANDHIWMLSTIEGPHARFRLKTDDGSSTTTLIGSGASLTTGNWHHVAATYDGATMRLYQDGVEVGSIPKSGMVFPDPSVTAHIGANPGDTNQVFNGRIDEVKLFGRALTPAEIVFEMTAPIDPPDPDTQAPTSPGSLSAAAQSSSTIVLDWVAATDDRGVAAYVVTRGGTTIATLPGTQLAFTDTNLQPGSTYSYTVAAVDAAANASIPAGPVSETTLPDDPGVDTEPPTEPGSPTAVATSPSTVVLAWDESQDNVAVAAYQVHRDGSFLFELSAPAMGYVDETAVPDSVHEYFITAFDPSGNSTASSPVFVTTPPEPPPPPPPGGLWAAYDFSASGSTVIDVSGNANDADLTGAASVVPNGRFGSAVEFTGSAGNVDLGGMDVPGDQLTIAAWVNADDFGVVDGRIISKASGIAGDDHYWMLSTITNQRLRFRLKTDDGAETTTLIGTGASLTAGTWHFVAATYDGAAMRLYIDGVEVGSTSKTGAIAQNPNVGATIGANPGNVKNFDGRIDELRLFTRALTASELVSLAATPVSPPVSDTEPPIAPGSFAGTATSPTAVSLIWTESSDNVAVASYIVTRDGVDIVTLSAPATNYTDSAASPDTTHLYFVTSVDTSGNVATSDPLQVTTPEAPPPPPPPSELWAAYDFSDPTSTVSDVSGNGHDGVLTGAATIVPDGQFGDAVELTGGTGSVDLGTLDISGDQLTIAAWVNADDFGVSDGRIISKATGTATNDHYWMLSTITNQRIRFRLKTDDGGQTTTLIGTGGALTAGTWHFVAATYDGATMRLFIDGVEVGATSKTGSVAENPAIPAAIGANPEDEKHFDGRIDELRIYTRALNASELNALASESLP